VRRFLPAAPAVALLILLTSCSSGSGGGGGSTTTFVPGKWTVTLFLSNNGNLGPVVEVDMNLTQTGTTISSNSDNTVDNRVCGGIHTDSTTGTVNGSQFNLVISINAETATLAGTLSADGKSIDTLNSKVSSSSGGPCFLGDSGGFSGNFVPPLTGTLTGPMQIPGLPTAPTVTAMLDEDSSFNVTGSMVVTNDPCFSSLTTTADNPGMSIGSLSSFEMTDGTNTLEFMGIVQVAPGLPNSYNAGFTVSAGCTQESGTMELNFDSAAAVARASGATSNSTSAASRINPVLVERLNALRVARHAHHDAP